MNSIGLISDSGLSGHRIDKIEKNILRWQAFQESVLKENPIRKLL